MNKLLQALKELAQSWDDAPVIHIRDDPYQSAFNDGVATCGLRLRQLLAGFEGASSALEGRIKEIALDTSKDYPNIENVGVFEQLWAIYEGYKGVHAANDRCHVLIDLLRIELGWTKDETIELYEINQNAKTADGFSMKVGDTVWVRNDKEGADPHQRVVGKITKHKINYAVRKDGYDGANRRVVFHLKENAYWK